MASWQINGVDTDGNQIDFYGSAGVQLAAAVFGSNVELNSYQDTSHVVLGSDHYCVNTHLNNTKYVDSTHLQINGGSTVAINPGTPVPSHQQVPLKVTFTHSETVTVTNPSIQAFDPAAPTSGAISDMSIYAFEASNHSAWKNINGTPQTFSARSGALSYDWYFALSALPIHGEPKTFGLLFTVAYV